MMEIVTPTRYGPLQDGFIFDLPSGYVALVGENNAGKSAILQLVFKKLQDQPEIRWDKACLLLANRAYVQPSTETGGSNLANFNNNLVPRLAPAPLPHNNVDPNIDWSQLPRLLLNHTDFYEQIRLLKELLSRLGMPDMILKEAQQVHFEDVAVAFQGSGLRSLMGILAALTDTKLSAVLIDEPELSLQPKLQRLLRDILVEAARSKRVLVSTHSHLFLNRQNLAANLRVRREGARVTVTPTTTLEQLYDLTFELLGNSVEDLFFPGNFLIVEGSSDQVITERVRDLLEIGATQIRVMSATGVTNVAPTVEAVSRVLVPVVLRDSPYARKVVAMIDSPNNQQVTVVTELRKVLGDRLFELDQHSIEAYVPADVYARAGRDKDRDLQQIAALLGRYQELVAFKKTLSQELAARLTTDDLPSLAIVVAAVRKAAE